MEKERVVELVQKAVSGDQNAMEQILYLAHAPVSYQCRKMFSNTQDAEDQTQEVLTTVYMKLNTLDNPAAFWGWLNRIVINQCKKVLERRHVDLQFAEDEDGNSILDRLETLDDQQVPDKALDNAETARMIDAIVSALPETQRLVTLMFYYDEMSIKEISQILEIPEGTVKSRLNHARNTIKERVQEYEKQGIKPYSVSILPFLRYFLRSSAQAENNTVTARACISKVMGTEVALGTTSAAATASNPPPSHTAAETFAGVFPSKIATKIVTASLAICSVIALHDIVNKSDNHTSPTSHITSTPAASASSLAVNSASAETTELINNRVPSATVVTTIPTIEANVETAPTETVHNHNYAKSVTPATCTTDGFTTYLCDCGDSYISEYVGVTGHNWNRWQTTKEPTDETEGQEMRSCSVCSCAEYRTLEKLPVETVPETAPTYETFPEDINVYTTKNEPYLNWANYTEYAAWIGVNTLEQSDVAVEEIIAQFECIYGFTPTASVSCVELGVFMVDGYAEPQIIYHYCIADKTYHYTNDPVYTVFTQPTSDGGVWCGFCIEGTFEHISDYMATPQVQALHQEMIREFESLTGQTADYMREHGDDYSVGFISEAGTVRTESGLMNVLYIYCRTHATANN